jgi:hypothetical protein
MLADGLLGELPDHEELPFEGRGHHATTVNINLSDDRHRLPGDAADDALVDGDVTPADDALALLDDGPLDRGFAGGAGTRFLGEKDHPDPIPPAARHLPAVTQAFSFEEAVRQLHEDTGPVSGFRVRACGTAMLHPVQHFQGLLDDRAVFFTSDICDKADATSVVFGLGAVKAPGVRCREWHGLVLARS